MWKTSLAFLAIWASSPCFGSEQAVGFYSNGSLTNASLLPNDGSGFIKILQPRNRGWATEEMLESLQQVAASMADTFPGYERMQIGDISAHEGGRLLEHESHQIGLDTDIIYFRVNRQEQDPQITSGLVENFVSGKSVTPNFDLERNWSVLKTWVGTGKVNRIFVDPIIKKTLCQKIKTENSKDVETLRRLRPWPNHDNHYHVRLICPGDSPRCVKQEEPPTGDGCNSIEMDPSFNEL